MGPRNTDARQRRHSAGRENEAGDDVATLYKFVGRIAGGADELNRLITDTSRRSYKHRHARMFD